MKCSATYSLMNRDARIVSRMALTHETGTGPADSILASCLRKSILVSKTSPTMISACLFISGRSKCEGDARKSLA